MSNSFLLPNQFYALASLRTIPGVQEFHKVGFNDIIPSTSFILLSNVTSAASLINFPASPMQMQVVSTSINDTAAGTGAQQVLIDYLTSPASASGFKRFTEIVTTNGVTPVLTVATNIYRIERFRVSRAGATLTSQGDISLQTVGGATTFEKIQAKSNVNRTLIHFIPNGFQSIITDAMVGTTTAGGVRFIIEAPEDDGSGNIVHFGSKEVGFANGSFQRSFNTPIRATNPNNKEMFFAIVVTGFAANQAASGSMGCIDILL